MTKTIIFSFFLVFVLTNCGTNIPAKVNGIPETSFWAGGVDGGQWYLIDSIDIQNETIVCKIYNDNNGELVANRKFQLQCSLPKSINASKWNNLQEEISSFDGKHIFLRSTEDDDNDCWFE